MALYSWPGHLGHIPILAMSNPVPGPLLCRLAQAMWTGMQGAMQCLPVEAARLGAAGEGTAQVPQNPDGIVRLCASSTLQEKTGRGSASACQLVSREIGSGVK